MATYQTVTPEKKYLRIDEKICRLCGDAKNYSKSTSIFSKAGKEKGLAKKIEKILNVVIDESQKSRLPCNVCRRCQEYLEKFDEFKAVVFQTQEMIKTNSSSKRCAKSSQPEPAKKSHPKKLQYDVSTNAKSQNINNQENRSDNVPSTQELISTCGLNDKMVCIV